MISSVVVVPERWGLKSWPLGLASGAWRSSAILASAGLLKWRLRWLKSKDTKVFHITIHRRNGNYSEPCMWPSSSRKKRTKVTRAGERADRGGQHRGIFKDEQRTSITHPGALAEENWCASEASALARTHGSTIYIRGEMRTTHVARPLRNRK